MSRKNTLTARLTELRDLQLRQKQALALGMFDQAEVFRKKIEEIAPQLEAEIQLVQCLKGIS
jgi:hypothetical protein